MNLIFTTFLLIFSLNPLFSPVLALSVGQINDAQKLLSFKSTLMNPNLLQNWGKNSDPCQFNGVFCNNNSRVTSINLSSISISTNFTTVSAHLLSIEFLNSISLSFTNISGLIHPFSPCSSYITQIDLSHNSISGSFFDLINLSSCSSLKSLNLSFNLLDSSNFLGKNQLGFSLETLDISGNQIIGEKILPWILSSKNCKKLGHLSVKGNKLIGSFSLENCPNLNYLDISSNNFSTKVPNFGKSCKNLLHLDISSNKFLGGINDELFGCNNLSFLNVSNNLLDGNFPEFSATKLEYLLMGSNKFEGVIPENFPGNFCSNLLHLDLSFNNFTGMIPSKFVSCTLLKVLDFSNNNFTGVLPLDNLLSMVKLEKLNLGFNKFHGVLPQSFSLFSSSSNLVALDLSSNNISGSIPPSICENTGLKEMYLQNNALTGTIPPNFGNCSELVSIDLSFNYLNGKIPSTLGRLSKLKDLIMWMNSLEGDIPVELMYNNALEYLILDYNQLTGPIPNGLRNCTNLSWISLSNNKLTGVIPSWIGTLNSLSILKLSSNLFYGHIPSELGECKSLLWLDLHSNLLNGTIPSTLGDQSGSMIVGLVVGKNYVYLRNSGGKECRGTGNLLEFAGIKSESLDRLSSPDCQFQRIYQGKTQPTFNHNGSMIFLDLSSNYLVGSIPKELGKMSYLSILNLGHNNLSGPIPDELGGLRNVGVLDLSYNRLSGIIPQSLGSLTFLTEIDLSDNQLSGTIPESAQFETFPASRFGNNSGLCGYPLPPCDKKASGNSSERQKHGRQVSLGGSIALGVLFSLFCVFGVFIIFFEVKKRRKKGGLEEVYVDGDYSHSGNRNSAWKYTSKHEALSINLATFEKPLRKLTFADLLEATHGFHDDSMIGKGGFGDVYKAQLKDGSVVAIKKLIQISGQGDREFMAEMETIGKIKHRNLVPLLGYCKVGEERLLVYEYMKHGSLEDVLHDRKKVGIKLMWSDRRKIAIGAARGLAFLHHNCIPHIIHRDMKSSNVLIDANLEARVSDFGMARLMSAMDTHLSVSTLAGTPGYVPPEYYQSFRCSTKGDVYSYGVVLLELLTGRPPTDSVDFGDNNLVGWVKMHAKLKISDVFDPVLIKEDPTLEIELLQHLKVACACLDDRPWKRPTMIQVMAMFKEIQAGSGVDSDSTVTTDDGTFSTVDVLADMSLKEVHEGNFK